MSLCAGLRLNLRFLSVTCVVLAAACLQQGPPCEGPGQCSAGLVCREGHCTEPVAGSPDAAARLDAEPVIDVGWVRDAGRTLPEDVGPIDTGRMSLADSGSTQDSAAMIADVGSAGSPGLGDPCRLPDFERGELDPCGIEDPNLFCLEQLNGGGAYCTVACAIEPPHHNEIDVGPHPHPPPCGVSGCCLRVDPDGGDGGPGEPIDRVCRFAPDCQ